MQDNFTILVSVRGCLGASDAGVSVSPGCLRGRSAGESVDLRRYCRDISAGVYKVQDFTIDR